MKKLGNGFSKIKTKHVLWAIVKSAVCGVSCGLLVTGVLLLALKLSAIVLAAGYYALIGGGTALIAGVASFLLLFRPTDKKVAKHTDDNYGLHERVQTALAYSSQSGTLIELQREDAVERIKALPARKPRFAKIWHFVVIFAVALAIGVAGITVPAKAATGEEFIDPDTTPRQVTAWELAGVRELIANIEASSLADGLKTSVKGVLEQLLDDLNTVNTEGTMAHAVNTAISGTSSILSATLSYQKIGAALTDADQVYLGQAVTNGGNVYQYYMLTTYDETRVFNVAKYDASNAKIVKRINSLRNDFTRLISDGLATLLGDTVSGVNAALAAANVSEEDGLYVLNKSFATSLSAIKTSAESGMNDTDVQTLIGNLISNYIVNLTNELSTQAYNAAINVFVSNRLKIIFGYLPLELPLLDTERPGGEQDTPDPGSKPPADPNDPAHGGPGTGETEYGSDDMVWVPGRGYVPYGQIIDEYYNLINQYLHSGELTEEQKSMVKAYYDILFGSGKNQ